MWFDSHDNFKVNVGRATCLSNATCSSSIFMDLFFLTTKEGLIFQERSIRELSLGRGQGTSNEEWHYTHNSWRILPTPRQLSIRVLITESTKKTVFLCQWSSRNFGLLNCLFSELCFFTNPNMSRVSFVLCFHVTSLGVTRPLQKISLRCVSFYEG